MSGLKEGLSVRYTVHQHEPVSPSHVSIPHSTLILCFHTRNEKLKKLSVNNSQSVWVCSHCPTPRPMLQGIVWKCSCYIQKEANTDSIGFCGNLICVCLGVGQCERTINTPVPLQSDLEGPTLFSDLDFYAVSIDDRFQRMINRSVLGIFASIFDYIQI